MFAFNSFLRSPALPIFLASILALAGCGSPNPANIQLRKQNQTLQDQVDQLTAQHQRKDGLVAEIRSLVYLGEDVQFQVLVDGRETMLVSTKANGNILPAVGERLTVGIDPGDVFVIPH